MPPGSYASNFGAGTFGGISNSNHASNNVNQNASTSAGNNFSGAAGGQRFRSIESHIMGYTFKVIVTRCVERWKYLKTQESISLYSDLRAFMAYVKETHGGVFRRVALSSILDSADQPDKTRSEIHTCRVVRLVTNEFLNF